jgi:hypothetical protein
MSKLIYYTPGRFEKIAHLPDVKVFMSLFKIFNHNISFVDRTGIIIPPIQACTPDQISIPKPDFNFNKSFDECAVDRARQIYEKHKEFGVPIRLSWSGGIDSSSALMSFIELLGITEARRCLEISLTAEIFLENPLLWERVVRKENFKVVNALQFPDQWDRSVIMVNGEGGDQVHGVDIYRGLIKLYGEGALRLEWNHANVVKFIKFRDTTLNDNEAEFLANLLINQVRQSPLEIVNFADFWWWINFTCKWASTFYRLLTKSSNAVTYDLVDNYFFPFYNSTNFQLWSMHKREEKHKGNWASYKWKSKEFVARVSSSPEYNYKHRQGSLTSVLSHTNRFEGIDDSFNFYDKINPEDWYNPNNSFKV